MNFGTFLLMQSPSARSSQEIYTRGLDIAQAAEALGFRNVWLAEHHFSTYGYLSRPLQLATYIAAKTTRLRVGTA
jgi:alkanesulfonate monooxygenase SsuD/methylene tetrahydromethanopterin reductase-like flavin-dependent oxidoreductase (luciferase family)